MRSRANIGNMNEKHMSSGPIASISVGETPGVGLSRFHPQRPRPGGVRPSLSNLSIRNRLTLLIGSLLFIIIAISIWASYRSVREAAVEVASARLTSLTQQLATLSQQGSVDLLSKTSIAANDAAILEFLRSPSATTRAGASTILQQFAPPRDPNSLQVELWRADNSVALVVPDGAPEPFDLSPEFKQCSVEPFKAVSPIRLLKETITYTAVTATLGSTGQPLGYLVRWRRVSPTPDARKRLADLLGSEAALYYGNADGAVWTDLEKAVPTPPSGLASTLEITHYSHEGVSVMALGRPVIGTPWFIVVEFPERVFLTQGNRFLRRMVIVGLVLLLLGLAGAFALSRSITKPLYSLTHAASVISSGDYSYVVNIRRTDELGELASAFNIMVVKARDSQRNLERNVQERTAQLQTANKELESFSYSVSHDLRAPLRHIDGFSQALLEDYGDKLDDVGQGYLQNVRGASQQMAQLIDDILQLARVTRSEMRREAVNLSEIACSVVAELQNRDTGRAATIIVEEGLSTYGDHHLLRIMLTNLLGNAWKFSSKRAHAEITFGKEQKDGEETFFVSDNGAGFDMAYVDKLFGAFQRLHSADDFEGTGIGLATIQRVVRRHGGRVWAEGAVDRGAIFHFTLSNSGEANNGEHGDLAG